MKIKECYKLKKESKKTGNPYITLCIEFENGYVLETFLSREQDYILSGIPLK